MARLVLLLALGWLALLTADADAATLAEPCRSDYARWKKQSGYGAFAYSRRGCGATWDASSLEEARKRALSNCRSVSRKAKCSIIGEIKLSTQTIADKELCNSEKPGVRESKIAACMALIKKSSKRSATIIWAYNERGRNFHSNRQYQLALDSYDQALRLDPKEAAHHFNRSVVLRELGRLEEAIEAANKAARLYGKADTANQKAAKETANGAEQELEFLRKLGSKDLCKRALTHDRTTFDETLMYASTVAEAKKRGFEAVGCRQLVQADELPAKVAEVAPVIALSDSRVEVVPAVDLGNASEQEICRKALSPTGLSWNGAGVDAPFVTEAKRRDLSPLFCKTALSGIIEGATGEVRLNSDKVSFGEQPPAQPTDASLCSIALNSHRNAWEGRPVYAKFVEQAKDRKLSISACRRALNLESEPSTILSGYSDYYLCGKALKRYRYEWDRSENFVRFVEEAERRKLGIAGCRKALGIVGSITLKMPWLSDDTVCRKAISEGGLSWSTITEEQSFVEEAERRELRPEKCREDRQPVRPNIPRVAGDDRYICVHAMSNDKSNWETRPQFNGFVREAQLRGHSTQSCVELINGPALHALSAMNDQELCAGSLDAARTAWNMEAAMHALRLEAERRGFSIMRCRQVLGIGQQVVQSSAKIDFDRIAEDVETALGNKKPSAPLEPQQPTQSRQRVALVIGNSNYQNAPRLNNPVNDAELMASSLERAGFSVVKVLNADRLAFGNAVLEFGRKLRGSDAGLVYYSGHGLQVNSTNYLIPVDADIEREDEIPLQSINVDEFMRVMDESASKVKIVVLDACRDNPFASQTRGLSRGLAYVQAPVGTFIAYSTSPGNVASDGDGTNSPFTTALAQFVTEPGLRLEDVFKRTRARVLADSDNRQVPWETSSMTGDFYFIPP